MRKEGQRLQGVRHVHRVLQLSRVRRVLRGHCLWRSLCGGRAARPALGGGDRERATSAAPPCGPHGRQRDAVRVGPLAALRWARRRPLARAAGDVPTRPLHRRRPAAASQGVDARSLERLSRDRGRVRHPAPRGNRARRPREGPDDILPHARACRRRESVEAGRAHGADWQPPLGALGAPLPALLWLCLLAHVAAVEPVDGRVLEGLDHLRHLHPPGPAAAVLASGV